MEFLCSVNSLCMERLDKELHNGPESQGSSHLLSCQVFQHCRHTSTMLQKHSTEGCIHPEKQRNQIVIETGHFWTIASPFSRGCPLNTNRNRHTPKQEKPDAHSEMRSEGVKSEGQGDRRTLTMTRHRGHCMCHKGLATQNLPPLPLFLHKPDNNAVSLLAVDTPKLSGTIVLASKNILQDLHVSPSQTLICAGRSFTLKVRFWFIFLVFERAMKLQSVRKEW